VWTELGPATVAANAPVSAVYPGHVFQADCVIPF
jgi:hypothetical protein